MGGLQPSDLIILAGRPGMGKTALATNVAYNVAKAWRGELRADGHYESENGGVVGFFSLEMSAEQLATRIISEQTGIASSTIRRGVITERDFEKIKDVSIELQQLPYFIDETGGLSVAQLAARARRLKRQRGLDLLVIDYIQLMQGSSRRAQECRSARCRIGLAILRTVTINARSFRTCGSPVRSNKTPTSSCLYSAKSTILRTRSLAKGPRSLVRGKPKSRNLASASQLPDTM
jgi:replicative DNA helicase